MQAAERIRWLSKGHLSETLTPEEGEELGDWITDSDENLALFEKLTDQDYVKAARAQLNHIEQTKMAAFDDVKKQIRTRNTGLKVTRGERRDAVNGSTLPFLFLIW